MGEVVVTPTMPRPEGLPDDVPMIDLPVSTVACRVHGELFRLKWPAGWLAFGVTLLQSVLETSDELHHVTGKDAHKLNAAIAEHGPLCRLATEDQRRAAYKAAAKMSKDWPEHAICAACNRWKQGMRGQYKQPDGDLVEVFACFDCVAHKDCQT